MIGAGAALPRPAHAAGDHGRVSAAAGQLQHALPQQDEEEAADGGGALRGGSLHRPAHDRL